MKKKKYIEKFEEMSDHDLLIKIATKTSSMCDKLETHLNRHWAVTIAIITAVVIALVAKYFNGKG